MLAGLEGWLSRDTLRCASPMLGSGRNEEIWIFSEIHHFLKKKIQIHHFFEIFSKFTTFSKCFLNSPLFRNIFKIHRFFGMFSKFTTFSKKNLNSPQSKEKPTWHSRLQYHCFEHPEHKKLANRVRQFWHIKLSANRFLLFTFKSSSPSSITRRSTELSSSSWNLWGNH